jgi:hypothetical protein
MQVDETNISHDVEGLLHLHNKRIFVCFFVYSRLRNFSATRRLSPLPATGLQIYTYA